MQYENKFGTYGKESLIRIKQISNILKNEIPKVKKELSKKYETEFASLNLPLDTANLQHIKVIAKKYSGYKVIVIGIGGSNLGTQAIHDSLFGKYSDQILFADTIDEDSLRYIISKIKSSGQNSDTKTKDKYLINIVSKSGNTTESIGNYFTILNELSYEGFVAKIPTVITTDKNSPLWDYAVKKNFDVLEIPKLVGGRYSVFSAVGLFPLAVVGVNIDKLLSGAKKALTDGFSEKSIAAKSAVDIYFHSKLGKNIAETFIFIPSMESVGKWYRQLFAESLGKEQNKSGITVNAGMTPTVAIGSTDLHSVGQLYLGGPKDKYFMFIVPQKIFFKKYLKIDYFDKDLSVLQYLEGKTTSEIMSAIVFGIQNAFVQKQLPFSTIKINSKDEKELGYLLQTKMLEVIYLGLLINVNSFDQPNVEEYKKITRTVLDKNAKKSK